MIQNLTTSVETVPLPKWDKSGRSPNVRYKTRAEAQREADRMAAEIVALPGIPFEIASFIQTTKSDLKVNPMVDGWRSPSPYYFRKVIQDGATVVQDDRVSTHAYVFQGRARPNPWSPLEWFYSPVVDVEILPRMGVLQPPCTKGSSGVSEGDIVTALAKQVKANGMNAALALVESRQTAMLLAEKLKQLAGIVKAVRKKNPKVLFDNWRKIRRSSAPSRAWKDLTPNQRGIQRERWKSQSWRVTRTVADEWLSFIYGVMPVIWDIEDLLKQLDEGVKTKDQLLIARASVRHSVNDVTSHSVSTKWDKYGVADSDGYHLQYEANNTSNFRHAGSLWFKIDNPTAVILKSVGFNNALAVAWDTVPLVSLLVDWVIPIGQYLDLLEYDHGLTYLGGSFTEFSEVITVPIPPAGNYRLLQSGARKEISLDRKVYATPPTVPRPSIRNPFRVERAISAVALIRQRLR